MGPITSIDQGARSLLLAAAAQSATTVRQREAPVADALAAVRAAIMAAEPAVDVLSADTVER